MPTAIPEPRLPLEPEEYPIYRPPRRLGCSGLSIITLLTIFLFAFLFLRVTPRIVDSFKTGVSAQFNASPFGTLDSSGTPIAGAAVDDQGTPIAGSSAPTNTPVPPPPPTATPVPQCVQVSSTVLILRDQANTALGGTRIPVGTKLQLLEPGTPAVKGNNHTWRHVQTIPDDGSQGKTGFVLDDGKYLTLVQCP